MLPGARRLLFAAQGAPMGRSLLCGPDGAGSKCPAWQNRNICGKYLPGLAWSWLCAAVTQPADLVGLPRCRGGDVPPRRGRPSPTRSATTRAAKAARTRPSRERMCAWEPSGRDRNLVGAGVGESDGEPYHLVAGAMPRNKGGNYRRFAHELLHLGTPMDQ